MKLTLKQKRFADEYIISGNAYKSAIKAGYSENYSKGNVVKLLENESVKNYLETQLKLLESKKIATMQEVHEFWAAVLREQENDLKDRLKASEYIAKTNGAFLEKVEISKSKDETIKQMEDYFATRQKEDT